MFLTSRLRKRRARLVPPSHVDERDDRYLLIWRDIPAWTVVDGELQALLGELDGRRTVASVLESRRDWASAGRQILRHLAELSSLGVLGEGEAPTGEGAPDRQEPPRIENVAVNVTKACNLRCRFCYYLDQLGRPHGGEITSDEVTGLLGSATPFLSPSPSLSILGGEPLLCPEKAVAIAEWGKRHGFTTILSTNGTLATAEFARAARRASLQVQVSIDGHTPELHDGVRGRGAFERAVAGVGTLVGEGAYTVLSMVCHQGNMGHLTEFYELALSLGVDEARFIPLKRIGGALAEAFEPVSVHRLVLDAFRMLKDNPRFLPLAGRDAFSILANTCRYSARRRSCGTGLQTFLLDADGAIYPCLNTNRPEFRVAGIRDAGFDFGKTWRESPLLAEIRGVSSVVEEGNGCLDCFVRHWCLGGCRGETYASGNDMGERACNCADLRRAMVETMWCLSERPDLVKEAVRVC